MVRVIVFVGVGGCLLGWEPELDPETDGGPETGADVDSSPPTCDPPAAGEPCSRYDARSVTIGGTLTPTISSDQGISDLYVYLDGDLQWHAWSTDLQNSIDTFTYGATPPGTTEGGAAVPLVAGVRYDVQLDALCFDETCAEAVSSVFRQFTAEP